MAHAKAAELRMSGHNDVVMSIATRTRHAVRHSRCLTVLGRSPTDGALFRPKCEASAKSSPNDVLGDVSGNFSTRSGVQGPGRKPRCPERGWHIVAIPSMTKGYPTC
jgi:hypothetical protein